RSHLDLEETEEEEMVHTWEVKQKGKLICMINDEDDEDNNLDVTHNEGMRE
ncbi:hypothetical protein KI387_030246, partial [Taxus chinensis]